jgi:transglutaminase-like putative cysteine protease
LACAVLLLAAFAFAQDGGTVFLHGIPLESRVPAGTAWADTRLVLQTPDEVPLFLKRRPSAKAEAGLITVDLVQPDQTDAPSPRHTKSSWLVDFSEKAFTPVFAELKDQKSVDGIVAFADHFIARKSMRRGFDLASQVARSHEGDCTEHAVFLAALLRHQKIPARVMFGMVLLAYQGEVMAFGHAWVEAWRGKRWEVADAAIPATYLPVYLPTGEIVEEGPGFAVPLVPAVQALRFNGLALVPR